MQDAAYFMLHVRVEIGYHMYIMLQFIQVTFLKNTLIYKKHFQRSLYARHKYFPNQNEIKVRLLKQMVYVNKIL